MNIRVIGPADYNRYVKHPFFVDTTHKAAAGWSKGLSPMVLGPVPLYGGRRAQYLSNALEFSKVYPEDVDENGEPSQRYWEWATAGWSSPTPLSEPKGREVRPKFTYWDGKRLTGLDARKTVLWPLYRNAVAMTPAFTHLGTMAERCPEIVLFAFDGFDEESFGMTLKDVLLDFRRPLSHAFILKAMLLHGNHVKPEDILSNNAQMALF
jgi:hypothetical protein